jgi:hypothetical protein
MESSNTIYLQLGDIIQIQSPTNEPLNDHIFLIEYIDTTKIKLKEPGETKPTILNITPAGDLSDESITSINILSRPESNSYAKQQKLLPGTFVDVYFNGDLPLTITGEITNLEEDMIEIKINDSGEIIYIDFGYKGVPDDIPIEKIIIRPPPEVKMDSLIEGDVEGERESVIESIPNEEGIDDIEDDSVTVQIPIEDIKNQLKDILLDADQIEFGSQLESITQIVEVPEERKRFGIETQLNELLDELLSSIPNAERTRQVKNNIHTEIERFKQLREKFSNFDSNGNANKPEIKGAEYKPIVNHLQKLNYKLKWILPVVQNAKNIYDLDIDEDTQIPDIVSLTLAHSRIEEYDIRDLYKTNTNNFSTYMKKMQPYLTPFQPDYNTDNLTSQVVMQNIDAVVDNLGNFYSSVAKKDSIKRKRFLISKYNLGLNKLHASKITSSGMISKTVPMTDNDLMTVNSFMTLPKSTMIFSNINLPNTTIYDKSNYNLKYLNYWQLLRENTNVITTFIDNLNTSIKFDENNYLKHSTQFILSDDNNDPDKYKKYLDIITPKTRVLFNLIKQYIDGKLSFVSVVNYLQPFLIYVDDISFKQYEQIIEFIETRIREYRISFAEKKELFSGLVQRTNNNIVYESMLYKLLKGRHDLSDMILENYGFNVNNAYNYKGNLADTPVLSNSEMIHKMMDVDYTSLYNTSISILNNDLITPFDFEDLLNQKQDEFDKNIEKEKVSNDCKEYVLTKRYIDLDDLNADNKIPIYFDKKYDSTVYDIIKEYDTEQSQMDPVGFKTFLIDQLVKNVGLKKPEARYEATSMLEGKRQIQDGQYAVLEIDNIDTVQYYYYKRENEQWIRDESIPINSFFGTNKLFCNIQEKCIKIDNTCADSSLGTELLKKDLVKNMYDEFDSEYQESLKNFKKKINAKFQAESDRITKLRTINRYVLYKYELKHSIMSFNVNENDDAIVSPYTKALDAIRGQSDIIKKQNDIVKFANKCTRQYIPGQDSDLNPEGSGPYWLYCIDTNTRLMPTFVLKLASVFVLQGDYIETINEIKSQQGVERDDQVVDKYSGWNIEKIALNTDAEYDKSSGFKLQSREILEMDAGAALLQSSDVDPRKEILELLSNPKGKMINNIITTISNYMGISIDNIRPNIIKHTLLALDKTVDSQDIYEAKIARMVKEGKKKQKSYEDVLYTSLITFTLSYICVFVQTSIPSIQSKKTFPGCKKSFQGYPLTGEEDLSNIDYLACVAAGIKSAVQPWKTLPKKQDKIAISIKKTIDVFILNETEILALIEQKRNYLLLNEDDFIPIELDIKGWINFLPPLQNIVNKTPSNLSTEFRNSLLDHVKSGSKNQFEQLRVIRSKIIYFSMAIIQSIQSVVEKEKLLLTNNSNIPFLQNACCNTGDYKTIDYFINKDSDILTYNDRVSYLYNLVFDMVNMSEATILRDPTNTKMIFPPLSTDFSEDTIYRAFIEYCNFSNDIPISDKLLSICLSKSEDFDKFASLQENIDKLKKEGKVYSIEAFNELINTVNSMNIIPLDMVDRETSNMQQLRDLIQHMQDSQNPIGEEFLTLFKNSLDTYDIVSSDNSDTKKLINYIALKNTEYRNDISSFIDKFADITKREKGNFNECILNIMEYTNIDNNYLVTDQDATLYKSIQFTKTAIYDFIYVFPTIIENRVDYDSIKIPTHWKLSQFHSSDIKNIIHDIYAPLKKFYDDKIVTPYLNKSQNELHDFYKITQLTYMYADIIKLDDSEVSSIMNNGTVSQLFEFYFLYMIQFLITLTDDLAVVDELIITPTEAENIITTSIELEEDASGELPDIDITRGQQKKVREKIADLIVTLVKMICRSKDKINYNSQEIKLKINRSKDKERQQITSTLGDMTKEQREVENLFKNHRLERWNKGLQKGLTQYVGKTYDEEREEREKNDIMAQHLDERELLGQTSAANREIDILEEQQREITENRINQDVYSMDELPEDDEYAEGVDDAYALQFDDNE